MSEIYQQIWNADMAGNGAKVVSIDPATGQPPTGTQAHVVLDEQVKASGKREIDLASRPLFRSVDPALLARPTYVALKALLDNYVVDYRAEEVTNPEEESEVATFVDLVLNTDPMSIAFDYVRSHLRPGIAKDTFRQEVQRMWFERFSNYYNGRSTHYCSGFEHVFVGEGKYRPRFGAVETKGEISGYHSWIKFYLDEISGRVDFLGYKYDLNGPGPDNPRVVTLQMIWNHQDFSSDLVAQLFKRKGGFFVGTSPEAEMALGTVAFYESAAGLVNNDKIRVDLGGDGRLYELVIYRNILQDGRRGTFIRSFFPMYVGDGTVSNPGTSTTIQPVNPQLSNRGPVILSGALPNPPGPGDNTGEWVAVRNVGEATVSLDGWELRDRFQRPLPLGGSLDAAGERQFDIVRTPNGMALGNKGGLITLHDSSGDLRAAVGYQRAAEGQVFTFQQT